MDIIINVCVSRFIFVEGKHNNTRYTKVGRTHAVSWPSIPELSGQLPFPCRLRNFRNSKRWGTEPRNSKQWVQNWGLCYSFHSDASDTHDQSLKTTQINQKSRAELRADSLLQRFCRFPICHETNIRVFKISCRQVTASFWKTNHKIKAGSDQCTVVLRTVDASMHEIG